MEQLRDWIWLSTLRGLSLRGQQKALAFFGSPKEAYLAGQGAIAEVPGLSQKEREALNHKDLQRAEGVLEDCQRQEISILTFEDPRYPQRLKNIDTPPMVLYYRGTLLDFDQLPVITVVGARKASGYGLTAARKLGQQLGACGATVVSGAARGIDSQALEGAISQGAKVAAVLGNGLDIVYPADARSLYEKIQRNGCLLSEFVPGTPPLAQNFPIRNRIMSGLSLGVLVVEAAKKSGSLITAELALEQGKDVFAIPGNIGIPACEGSNGLIQEGAALVTCGWDILREYAAQFPEILQPRKERPIEARQQTVKAASPVQRPAVAKSAEGSTKSPQPEKKTARESENRIDNGGKAHYIDFNKMGDSLTEDEKAIVEILRQGQRHVDDVIEETGLGPARVLASLTLLEVKGFVTQQPGKRFDLNI